MFKTAMRVFLRELLLVFVAGASCWGAPLKVSVFSSVLAEVATQVGGGEVEVTSHVPAGTDPHEFEPKPADLKTVSKVKAMVSCLLDDKQRLMLKFTKHRSIDL